MALPPGPGAPEGELSTYISLMEEAHMLGKTHVGTLRGGGKRMQDRVFQMTSEVLEVARRVMNDLELLQEDYVVHYCRQRGTVPTFNGAWGTMHVMKALYQQLSSEVDGELDKLVEAGQKPNLYNKRVGWNERASMDWQVALLGNERSTAVEKKRQATALRKANAAASMIQGVWRARENRKSVIRAQHDAMRHTAVRTMAASAFSTMLDRAKLRHREHNQKRRGLGMNLKEWEEVETEYQDTGALDLVPEDQELGAVPEDAVQEGDYMQGEEGEQGEVGEEGEEDGRHGSGDGESGEVTSPRYGAGAGRNRRYRKFKQASMETSHLAAKTAEAVAQERNTRSRIAQKRYKQAFNANRLASLAAPKKPVDLEDLRRKQANAPVWKAGGAAKAKGPQRNAHSLMRRNMSSSSYASTYTASAMEIAELESVAQFYDSLKTKRSKWDALKVGLRDNTTRNRLSKLKGLSRHASRIHAPESMKRRLQRALENFEEFGMSLDGWVRENKHVLQLIHDDAKREGTTTEKAAAAAAQSGEEDDASAKHKALIAQQILVMSSMWGLLKKNLMDAQEAILHMDPKFKPETYSMEELRDGTAVVLKMWREISERVSPLQVALGSVIPDKVMVQSLQKAEKEVKHQVANPHLMVKQESEQQLMSGLLSMFQEQAKETSATILPLEKKKEVPKARARYLEPRRHALRSKDKERAEAEHKQAGMPSVSEVPEEPSWPPRPPPRVSAATPTSKKLVSDNPLPTRQKTQRRTSDGDAGEYGHKPQSRTADTQHDPAQSEKKSLAVEARAEAHRAREAGRRAREAGPGYSFNSIAESSRSTSAEQMLQSGHSMAAMRTSSHSIASRAPPPAPQLSNRCTSDGASTVDEPPRPPPGFVVAAPALSQIATAPQANSRRDLQARASMSLSPLSSPSAGAFTPSSGGRMGSSSGANMHLTGAGAPRRAAAEPRQQHEPTEQARAITAGVPTASRDDRISQLLQECDLVATPPIQPRAKTSGSMLPSIPPAEPAPARRAPPKLAFAERAGLSSAEPNPKADFSEDPMWPSMADAALAARTQDAAPSLPAPRGREGLKPSQQAVRGQQGKAGRQGFVAMPTRLPFGMHKPESAATASSRPASVAAHAELPHQPAVRFGIGSPGPGTGGMRGASRGPLQPVNRRQSLPNSEKAFAGAAQGRRSMPALNQATLGLDAPLGTAPRLGDTGHQRGGLPRTVMVGRRGAPGMPPPENSTLRQLGGGVY